MAQIELDLSPVERPKSAAPWTKVSAQSRTLLFLASTVPAIIYFALYLTNGFDFMSSLIVVFLPLQVIATSLVGIKMYGRRGILDSLLVVATIFLACLFSSC